MTRFYGLLAGAILLGFAGHLWTGPRIASGQGTGLPQGEGAELVSWRCTICHSVDAPSLARQGREGWTETVDRMIRWGAPIGPEEREIIIRYLVVHFGPLRSPGETTLRRRPE